MYQTMLKAKAILNEIEIPFWLDSGTLLFMYRNHTPDDTDTDFAIYEKDISKLLHNLDKFFDAGFTLHKIWTHPVKNVIEVSLMDGDKKVDIFVKFYKRNKAYTLSSLPDDTFNAGVYPKRHFESLDKLHHEGTDWNIPNDVENYLRVYYGEDWRTPKPQWDWTKDAPCIVKDFI